MESFRAALDRLTKNFVSELLGAVEAEAAQKLAEQQKRETRPKPTRIVRTAVEAPSDSRAVVVRHFDIPVGQPRKRRRRTVGASPARKPAPTPPPQVVKF